MKRMDRRDFLKGTAWMGAAAFAAGCCGPRLGFGEGGKMAFYADRPFERLRVGIVGLGRGFAGVSGFSVIPGCEITALCDLNAVRVQGAVNHIRKAGHHSVLRVYSNGPEDWKRLCDDPNVDLVYNATPWELHVPIALYAMNAGKHVVTEVPSAFTVDECWELVETSEKLERHCMQLENCCYGEEEMLALNLCRLGKLGDLVHGEGAYIHDLRDYNWGAWNDAAPGKDRKLGSGAYWNYWRLRHNAENTGNQYPTHGLGPICQYMNINRGDAFDYLVSVGSDQFGFEKFARDHFPEGSWQREKSVEMGDMNSTLVRTHLGRSILVQHDVSSPRPYTRLNLISGTKGIFAGYPYRVGWEEKPGKGVHKYFDEKRAAEVRREYMHPLWKQAGEIAKKMGGHGGMDFLMVLRLAYCLQNGLPLDQNVYDLASWCSLCELSKDSVEGRKAMDVPDFTRGAWKTTTPLGIETVDLAKMGFKGNA